MADSEESTAFLRGKYHLRNISSKYPIPGSAIAIERKLFSINAETKNALETDTREEKTMKIEARTSSKLHSLSRNKEALQKKMIELGRVIELRAHELQEFERLSTKVVLPSSHPIIESIDQSDEQRLVLSILELKQPLNFLTEQGETLLARGCKKSCLPIIKILLDYGADPRQRSEDGETCLHALWFRLVEQKIRSATESKEIAAIARIILENGAEPNVIGFGPSRETLLHRVAAGGFEHIVFCLLEYGADPNIIDAQGKTPAKRAQENLFFHISRLISAWSSIQKQIRSYSRLVEFNKLREMDDCDDTTSHLSEKAGEKELRFALRSRPSSRSKTMASMLSYTPQVTDDISQSKSGYTSTETKRFLPELSRVDSKRESNIVLQKVHPPLDPLQSSAKRDERVEHGKYRRRPVSNSRGLYPFPNSLDVINRGLKRVQNTI